LGTTVTNQHYDHEDVKGQIRPTFGGINLIRISDTLASKNTNIKIYKIVTWALNLVSRR